MSTKNKTSIDNLVNKFLSWPLPKSVRPDGDPSGERYGTNLLTADEAAQMFEYCFAANLPQTDGVWVSRLLVDDLKNHIKSDDAAMALSLIDEIERGGMK